jgi:predicted  nucleic acid-binding Zn-ribbon protein
MKKFISIMAVGMAILSSCSNSEKANTEQEQEEAIQQATREELATAVSDRDQLLSLMNEIQEGLNDIKNLENIVTVNTSETPDRREQIKNDIAAIQQALADRQTRLDQLEKKLSSSNLYSANLKKTIESLRSQIETQSAEIDRLNGELANAHKHIAELGNKVDSLNTTVSNVSSERDAAKQHSEELSNEMNICYYAFGSNKELKDHKILESGFLKKTKIMKSDFDQDFFTKADKRNFTVLQLHSNKAEVLTNQPADSYTITDDANGKKVLKITNPEKFWSLTNYLVIKVN